MFVLPVQKLLPLTPVRIKIIMIAFFIQDYLISAHLNYMVTLDLSISEQYVMDACDKASAFGYSDFEGVLTSGGDDRSLISDSGANKYHIKPRPINDGDIFRG